MTLSSDPNYEEKLTFYMKNDIRNLMNFNSSNEKSENLHFDGILLDKPSLYNVLPEGMNFLTNVAH